MMLVKISKLPDLSMSKYLARYGSHACDISRNVLANVATTSAFDTKTWISLRYDFYPYAKNEAERLAIWVKLGNDPVARKALESFYELDIQKSVAVNSKESKWFIKSICKAEEADIQTDDFESRLCYAPVPCKGNAKVFDQNLWVDELFSACQSRSIVDIFVRPVNLLQWNFRDDLISQCQNLELWSSGFESDRCQSGTLEELARHKDYVAARHLEYYKWYFEKFFPGRGYEYFIRVASHEQESAEQLARNIGINFFPDNRFMVVDYANRSAKYKQQYKGIQKFEPVINTYKVGETICYSEKLSNVCGRHTGLDPEKYQRACRLSKFLNITTESIIGDLLSLPVSNGVLPKTISLESEESKESSDNNSIEIGSFKDRNSRCGIRYDQLPRHILLCGTPGSGKTVTSQNIAFELWEKHRIPFLVLEPIKGEYRELWSAGKGLDKELRFFTPGDEALSPFRFNPFEIPPYVTVDEHIASMEKCFEGAFSLGGPMPYLLGKGITKCYEDVGLFPDDKPAKDFKNWPTMTDLVNTMENIIDQANYKGELDGNLRAAIRNRLTALTERSIGYVFDNPQNMPSISELLSTPTVIEMSRLGSEQKNLLMLFLITNIREWFNGLGPIRPDMVEKPIRHMLIIEEAHNLIGNETCNSVSDEANPKLHAARYLTAMLAEARALGESIMICDQSPSAIQPEVLKLTNTKICHKITDGLDRETMAQAMLLGSEHIEDLARLKPGYAFIHHEGLHRPRIVKSNFPTRKCIRPIDSEIPGILQQKKWYVQMAKKRVALDIGIQLKKLQSLLVQAKNKPEEIKRIAISEIAKIRNRISAIFRANVKNSELAPMISELIETTHTEFANSAKAIKALLFPEIKENESE